MRYEEMMTSCWAFEAKLHGDDTVWTRSEGRWDEKAQATLAAADWFVWAHGEGWTPQLRVVSVEELRATPASPSLAVAKVEPPFGPAYDAGVAALKRSATP